jgi:hypothetical protein
VWDNTSFSLCQLLQNSAIVTTAVQICSAEFDQPENKHRRWGTKLLYLLAAVPHSCNCVVSVGTEFLISHSVFVDMAVPNYMQVVMTQYVLSYFKLHFVASIFRKLADIKRHHLMTSYAEYQPCI